MYTLIDKNDKYIELVDNDKKIFMPTNAAIIVDDESDLNAIKTIASRRTIALAENNNN